MATTKTGTSVCPPAEEPVSSETHGTIELPSGAHLPKSAISLRQAMDECSTRMASCRKLLDELKKILAQSRTHQSYQNGCAARDALSNTLGRLEKRYAAYKAELDKETPSESSPADRDAHK